MSPHYLHPNAPSRVSATSARKLIAGCAAFAALLLSDLIARTWTSADGTKTFEGELKSYDTRLGLVQVRKPDGTVIRFRKSHLSAADIAFLQEW